MRLVTFNVENFFVRWKLTRRRASTPRLNTLKHLRATALGGRTAYPYVAGIDGNDPRLIDVAASDHCPVVMELTSGA